MNEQNSGQKQETAACGPGCSCGGASTSCGRSRWVAGVVVLVIAGVLVARAVVKNNRSAAADNSAVGFAAAPVVEQASAPETTANPAVAEALKEIASFAELNQVAMGSKGVFIYVPGNDASNAASPVAVMRGAARTIEPQLRGTMGLFALKTGSSDYVQIAGQMPVPGVIALVPGGRMVPVSGEITETKLIQGLVGSVQSCGAGGCGPSGCN